MNDDFLQQIDNDIDKIKLIIDHIILLCTSVKVFALECDAVKNYLIELKTILPTTITNSDDSNKLVIDLRTICDYVNFFQEEAWNLIRFDTPLINPINYMQKAMKSISDSLDNLNIVLERSCYFSIEIILMDIQNLYDSFNDLNTQDPNVQAKLYEIKTLYNFFKKVDRNNFTKQSKIFFNSSCTINRGQNRQSGETVNIIELNSDVNLPGIVQILAFVHHPNVEEFIGYDDSEEPFVIVTKSDGEDLNTIIKRHRRRIKSSKGLLLKKGSKTKIAFSIALGMSYLHSKKIIHRDLCTSNIMIDGDMKPRIINFVNSRFQPDKNITISVGPKSSSKFRAPEIITCELYNESVDTFAFGTILYQLLTFHKPFHTFETEEIERKCLGNERPELPANASEDLKDLILRCWAQEPKKRPSFSTIVDEMLNKKITFPDEDEDESVNKFYSDRCVKDENIKSCIKLFEKINQQTYMSVVYDLETARIRSFLCEYQYLLETSDYAASETLDDVSSDQVELLIQALNNLKEQVDLTIVHNWIDIALSQSVDYIPKNLCQAMDDIYKCMLYFDSSSSKYVINNDDYIGDLRYLYRIFMYNKEHLEDPQRKIQCDDRINETKSFLNKIGFDVNFSKNEMDENLKKIILRFEQFKLNRDDFIIGRILGGGASSIVHKGEMIDFASNSKKKVAIKEFIDGYFESEAQIIALIREISFLAQLKHEYLISFIGFCKDEDKPLWIVTQYYPGKSLHDQNNSLDATKKTKIAFEIAEGMEYLHQNKIMHRDLKPDNILLDGITPKIADFGLARTDLTINSSVKIGTLNYMAPEVFNSSIYGMKADIYSFGLTVWELYSKERPPERTDGDPIDLEYEKPISDILDEDQNQERIDFRDLIEMCTSQQPEKRPTFTKIIELMIKYEIAFFKADRNEIHRFYKMKAEKRAAIKPPHQTNAFKQICFY